MFKTTGIFFVLSFFILSATSWSQPLQINLIMSSRPSPYLSDWQLRRETASIVVTNLSTQIRRVRFDTRISRESQIKAKTKFNSMPTIELPPGMSTFNCENLIPLNAVDFFGDDKNIGISSGKLPAGVYEICVALLSDTTGSPLTQDQCRSFQLVSYQAPTLLQPSPSAVISCLQAPNITFRWTPISPLPPPETYVGYEFALFEVHPDQSAIQAFRTNTPIVRTTVASAAECFLRFPADVDISSLFSSQSAETGVTITRNFVWSVRCLDLAKGIPLTDPDGWAEPQSFSIQCENTIARVCVCEGSVLGMAYAPDSNPSADYVGGPVYRVAGNTTNTCTYTSSVSFWLQFALNCVLPCVPKIDAQWTLTFTDVNGKSTSTSGSGISIDFQPPGSGTISVHCSGSYYCDKKKCSDFDFSKTISVSKSSTTATGSTTKDGGVGGGTTGGTTSGGGTTGGGGTTTPGGGTTTEKTQCGCDCICKAEIKDGKSEKGRFSYTGIADANCLARPCTSSGGSTYSFSCSAAISTKWILSIGADVVDLIPDPKNPFEVALICKKPGFFHLIFRVDVICSDGAKCFCIADREGYCPPTDTFGIECFPPSVGSLVGPSVSLGSTIESPEQFPYPRAVPIRASAIDKDLGTIRCLPCKNGPLSVQQVPVPDAITYHWKLSGKGSLNSMPSIQKANDIDKEIQELQKKIAEVRASIDSLQQLRDRLPKELDSRKAEAKLNLAALQLRIDSVDTRIKSLSDSVATWKELITKKEKEQSDVLVSLKDSQEQSRLSKKSMDSLDLILQAKPKPDELTLMKTIQTEQSSLRDISKDRDARQKKLTARSGELGLSLGSALSELKSAQSAYESLRANSSSNAKSIGQFQTQMYPVGAPREYFQAQKDFSNKATLWVGMYASSPSSLLSTLDALERLSDSAVASSDRSQRSLLASQFSLKLSQFSSQMASVCVSIADTAVAKQCAIAQTSVNSSSSAYASRFATVVASAFTLDKNLKLKIKSARAQIESQASALKTASDRVRTKAEEYAQLIESTKTELGQLSSDLNLKQGEVDTKTNELAALQESLRELREKYQAELQALRPILFEKYQVASAKKKTADSTVRAAKDSLSSLRNQLSDLHSSLEVTLDQSQQEKAQRSKLIDAKAALQLIIDKNIDAQLAGLDRTISDKKKLVDDLLKKIDAKQKERDTVLAGRKEDDGEVVYYIPPPLEEIMTVAQTKQFEELKDSLKSAESDLEAALMLKQLAQKKLFLALDRISRELVSLKDAKNAQSDAENAMTDASFNQAAKKNEAKKKLADEQLKAQQEVTDAEKALKEKQQKVDEYQSKVDALKKQIETQSQTVEQTKKDLLAAMQKVKDMKAQLDKEKELLSKAQQTHEERIAEFDKATEEFKEKTNARGRAQSALNHAVAANDETAATQAAALLQSAIADESTASQKVDKLKAQLVSTASSVESATARVSNATDSYDKAKEEFSKKSQKKIADIDALNDLNQKLEKDLGPRLINANSLVSDAKEKLEESEKARTELNDAINKGLDTLKLVKKQQEKIDELKKDIDAAKEKAKDAQQSITDALKDRDQTISTADSVVKQARKKLAQRKEELHTFLVGIFEHIETTELNNELLTISADDKPMDGWRSKDAVAIEVKPFRYLGRIPQFANTVPAAAASSSKDQGECPLTHGFEPSSPIAATDPVLLRNEPRTLALMYKNGEPLWREWPVIPNEEKLLARDYSLCSGSASDVDLSVDVCGPSSSGCIMKKNNTPILDEISYLWALDGASVLGLNHQTVVWKAPEVDKPSCKKQLMHTLTYMANAISVDPPVDRFMKPTVKAGVLVEVSKELLGVINGVDTCVARVVCGDHKGLSSEDIRLSVKPKAGFEKLAKDYGFESKGKHEVVKKTDSEGYVRVPFLFGSQLAEFEISIEWKRDGCEKKELIARTPIYLQFLRFADGAPTLAFTAAKQLWQGTLDIDAAVASLPDRAKDPKKDKNYTKITHAVVGLVDYNRDSLNGVGIEFSKKKNPTISLSPSIDTTELFGFARTVVDNLPKNDKLPVFVDAQCAELHIRSLCTPKEVSEQKAGKLQRFKIGSKAMPFIVELDQPASANEKIYGKAKLVIESVHEFLQNLTNIPLSVNGVVLAEDGAEAIAQSGFVSWKPTPAKNLSYKGFEFNLDSLSITASLGAMIGGSIKQQKYIPEGVNFFAELETSGNFYGSISEIPEIKFGKCTLKQGSALTLDMSSTRDDDGVFDELKPFVGIVINKAELVLPPTFSTIKDKDTTASELSVENFAIGRKVDGGSVAIGGKVKISGSFFNMGFGGWKCSVSSLDLSFANSEIKEGTISGGIEMPMPFEGSLEVELKGSKENWTGSVATKNPISVPKLKTVFSILDGTSISYKPANSLAQVCINATLTCEYFKRMDIRGLTLDNNGTIIGEVSITNPKLKFGRGFDLDVSKITLKKSADADLSLSVKGSFAIPNVMAIKGSVELTTGPSVSVSLDETKIKFEYGPCNFDGSLAFSSTEFRGEFDIGIKNLIPNGIQGKLIAGIQNIDTVKSYTYWYAELSAGVTIPLGQTGMFITKLGGGLGYNYEPPVGNQQGNPKELPNSLAFKAIVGIGTPGTGMLMNSRVEMVLIPWTNFSLYGKLWLLNKPDALFGEGQLNLSTEPPQLDGYVRVFIGLPDAQAKLLSFDGKLGFMYSSSKKYIKSEKLSGQLLQVIKAEGQIELTEQKALIKGNLRYDFDKKISLGVVDFGVSLHANAFAGLEYICATSSLDAEVGFVGNVDVKGDFPIWGLTTLLSGQANVKASLHADPRVVRIDAKVHCSYNVFGYSDSLDLDVGYSL